jgi:hypothetical protein
MRIGFTRRIEMRSIKRYMVAGALSLSVLLLAGIVLADENNVAINTATIIHSQDNGDFRILMRPEIQFPDTTIVVDRAILNLRVSPQTDDTTFISIRLHAITMDWDAGNVNWDSPWVGEGGDYDSVFYAEKMITLPENQEISIDVTDLCMRWADGRLPYYGFLLRVSRSSLAGFTVARQNNDAPWATFTIKYTPIPPLE